MKPIHDNYITIQGWMVTALNLKGSDLQLFALIHGFCQDRKGRFSGSLSYIEMWLNTSRPTVIAAINRLGAAGWIITHVGNINQANEYSVNWKAVDKAKEVVKKLYQQAETGSKETLPEVVKNFYQGSKEALPNIYSNTDNDNIESAPAKIPNPKDNPIPVTTNQAAPMAENWHDAAQHLIALIEANPSALQYNLRGARPLPGDWKEKVRERMRHFAGQGEWHTLTIPSDLNGRRRKWEAQMCAKVASWIDSPYNAPASNASPSAGMGISLNDYKPKI